ncbi:MAG TPA: ABC transporter permease [Anaeromyxobacteraceae bacterium]|nr:ABC transporter permease [Anaeromyxobacteraceae bacterium]
MTEPTATAEPRRSPLWQLTLARIRLFYREPSVLFWTFLFPILLTVALGIAFRSRPPEAIRVAVVAGPAAEATRAALAARQDVEATVLDEGPARSALRTGRVAVVVEPGPAPVLRFDPTRPESRLAHLVVDDLLERAAGRRDVLTPREETASEPGSRYVDFLIPGLLGMNIMSTGMWGIGYVIVENRQKKLLKRLAATPMRRGHFLLSFAVVRSLFLALEVPFLLGFGVLTFGVPLRGALGTLAVVVVAGAVAFAGLGLLVASRAANVQTVSGLINLVMMPMMLMSGVFFSSEHFPALLQPLVRALPLTALNDAVRAVMNDGASLLAVAPQVGLLAAVGAASFALALRIFRWV